MDTLGHTPTEAYHPPSVVECSEDGNDQPQHGLLHGPLASSLTTADHTSTDTISTTPSSSTSNFSESQHRRVSSPGTVAESPGPSVEPPKTAGLAVDIMSFLDPDSPVVTRETIERFRHEDDGWATVSGSASEQSDTSPDSPKQTRSAKRTSSDPTFEPFSQHATTKTDASSASATHLDQPIATNRPLSSHKVYMPRPSLAHQPMMPMPAVAPAAPIYSPSAFRPHFAEYPQTLGLPSQESLPVQGYRVLAAELANKTYESPIRPIYRRFDSLNHRLILQMQDELAELEEELHHLDIADTRTRLYHGIFEPPSRRREHVQHNELLWRRAEVLGHIGHKLWQYNQALVAYNAAAVLPRPSKEDVRAYRTYLATARPIAEEESRFLDHTDELITLAEPESRYRETAEVDDSQTPVPGLFRDVDFPMTARVSDAKARQATVCNTPESRGPSSTAISSLKRVFILFTSLSALALASILVHDLGARIFGFCSIAVMATGLTLAFERINGPGILIICGLYAALLASVMSWLQ